MWRTSRAWNAGLRAALPLVAPSFFSTSAGGETSDPGVSAERVLFGQSAALSGPAESLGRDIKLGIELAFGEINRRGGLHGRRLELVSRDDGYEPTRAIENTQALLGEDEVFALIGEVGTPTARSVVPLAEERGVPFVAPFTGAGFLRDPELAAVINLRASYEQEAERGIAHLVDREGLRRIAVLFQDDTFGRDGLACVARALHPRANRDWGAVSSKSKSLSAGHYR